MLISQLMLAPITILAWTDPALYLAKQTGFLWSNPWRPWSLSTRGANLITTTYRIIKTFSCPVQRHVTVLCSSVCSATYKTQLECMWRKWCDGRWFDWWWRPHLRIVTKNMWQQKRHHSSYKSTEAKSVRDASIPSALNQGVHIWHNRF